MYIVDAKDVYPCPLSGQPIDPKDWVIWEIFRETSERQRFGETMKSCKDPHPRYGTWEGLISSWNNYLNS